MRSLTFLSLCTSTLGSNCSWGFWRNPEHHFLHYTAKLAVAPDALKSCQEFKLFRNSTIASSAWVAQAGSATRAKGCLGVRELCKGQDTPERQQSVHRGMRRGALWENSRLLENKKVSEIPMLHWRESGTATQICPGDLHQPPQNYKTSPQHHTGHQNRAQFKGENRWQRKSPYKKMVRNRTSQKGAGEIKTNDKCDWKRRKTIHSISRYPCPPWGGWHRWAHGWSSFCCFSIIIILLWQSLMDRLFCYLANFSLKQLSPTHEYIHTCINTHLGTVSGTIQAWSKAQLPSSHARLVSGCLLTALQLQNPVLANDFSKPCCTKENRFNLYISA